MLMGVGRGWASQRNRRRCPGDWALQGLSGLLEAPWLALLFLSKAGSRSAATGQESEAWRRDSRGPGSRQCLLGIPGKVTPLQPPTDAQAFFLLISTERLTQDAAPVLTLPREQRPYHICFSRLESPAGEGRSCHTAGRPGPTGRRQSRSCNLVTLPKVKLGVWPAFGEQKPESRINNFFFTS